MSFFSAIGHESEDLMYFRDTDNGGEGTTSHLPRIIVNRLKTD